MISFKSEHYLLTHIQEDKGTCRLCGKVGVLMRGRLTHHSLRPPTMVYRMKYISLGPYCLEHGGLTRVEIDLMKLMEDPGAVSYAFNQR